MAKRGTPALYELLGRQRDASKPGGAGSMPVVPMKVPPREPGRTSLGGGIRLPSQRSGGEQGAGRASVGGTMDGSAGAAGSGTRSARHIDPTVVRVLLGSALGLALLIGVYKFGLSRGGAVQQADASQSASSDGADAAVPAPSVDPSSAAAPTARQTAPTVTNGSTGAGAQRPPSENQAASAGASTPAAATANPGNAGNPRVTPAADSDLGPALGPTPAGLDPRQAGLNYWVLANVLEANAPAIVQYCRDRGLDAWVVPDQNGRLREITVLPGIPKSELNGATANALKTRVRKIGAQLKAAGRVNDGFEGAYFKLFKG